MYSRWRMMREHENTCREKECVCVCRYYVRKLRYVDLEESTKAIRGGSGWRRERELFIFFAHILGGGGGGIGDVGLYTCITIALPNYGVLDV